jgi:hypothetical protein
MRDFFLPVLQVDVMRLRVGAITVVLTLAGCGTSDDVKKTGLVWSGTYAARYDQLASCLSARTEPYYKATLQFDPNDKRATVTYSIPVTGIPVEVYDIRQTSDNATDISWWSRLESGRHAGSPLYLMRLCGASPLSAAASPVTPVSSSPAPATPQAPVWAPEPTTDTPGSR